MTNLLTKPISLAEYLLLPYDRKKTELVDGKVVEIADASPLHIDIIAFLSMALETQIADQALNLVVRAGPGVEIPKPNRDSNVRDPDLIVCDRTQWKAMRYLTKAIFVGNKPPAMAIEVVSPGSSKQDTIDKRQEYALAGVPEYWIVNPIDGYVLVLLLDSHEYRELGEYRGDDLIESALLPRLKLTAGETLDP